MAIMKINFSSKMLMRMVEFNLILPNDLPEWMTVGNKYYDREIKTLYLLHGFGGNCNDWLYGSLVQELSIKYNLAIVMPSGENSFYLDGKGTGKLYGEFIGKELVEYIRRVFRLSDKRENTFIGGLSMGGFGAIRSALKYNDTFGKAFGLSSALIVNEIKNQRQGFKNEVADYDYFSSIFGDLSKLEESENNPEYLIKKLKSKNRQLPAIFMVCGTEDFLLEKNREFYKFLSKEDVKVNYEESEGTHDWKFWNGYFEKAICWLLD